MGSDIGLVGEVGRRHNVLFNCWDAWGLRGADVFSILSQVAFGCRQGLGKVLANEGGREPRPSCKETSIDGLCPGFDNGAEAGTVEIDD